MLFGKDLQSALKIDGYYVWCGSVIRGEDGRYHMVAKDMRGDVGGSEADGVECCLQISEIRREHEYFWCCLV